MTVILVTLDGVRPDAVQQAHTPNLNRMMAEGAYTLTAQAVMPTMTLPCHMSLFHSVPPQRHGILTNDYHPMARPVPGLFEVLHQAGKRCAMLYSWEPLRDVARPLSLDYAFFQRLDFDNLPVSDEPVVAASEPLIRAGAYDFVFVYIGATDEIGHLHGWMSAPYLRQVEIADKQLGVLLDAMQPDDVILVEADHGGHDRSHGTDAPEDMTIPWLLMGSGVRCGVQLSQHVTLLDTAPTIVSLLGVGGPVVWEGTSIAGAIQSG
jgi:predicted AlkP superfamily pyrophosphatase or phosphodiesterase